MTMTLLMAAVPLTVFFLLVAAPVTVVLGSASGRWRAAMGRRASAVRRVGVSGGLVLLRWW